MPFQKGNKLAGSRKGKPNKINADIKEMILKALKSVGGEKWLVKLANEKPEAFATLLGKLLPKDIALSGKEGESAVEFVIRGYNGGNQDTGA